jgi:hypothetical protein
MPLRPTIRDALQASARALVVTVSGTRRSILARRRPNSFHHAAELKARIVFYQLVHTYRVPSRSVDPTTHPP